VDKPIFLLDVSGSIVKNHYSWLCGFVCPLLFTGMSSVLAENAHARRDVPCQPGSNPYSAKVYQAFTPQADTARGVAQAAQQLANSKTKPGNMICIFTGAVIRRSTPHTRLINRINGPPERPCNVVLQAVRTSRPPLPSVSFPSPYPVHTGLGRLDGHEGFA
jgi:hypothetical protein